MQRISPLRSRFFWKIYLTYCGLFLVIIVNFGVIGFFQIENALTHHTARSLSDQATLLETFAADWFKTDTKHSGAQIHRIGKEVASRVTVFDPKGQWILDSSPEGGKVSEQPAHHPEVLEALNAGQGFTKRYSADDQEEMYYLAKVYREDERVLGAIRIGVPTSQVAEDLQDIRYTIFAIAFLALTAAFVAGWELAKRVAAPMMEIKSVCQQMMRGDYEVKLRNLPKDEFGDLGKTLNALGFEITRKIKTISQDKIQLRRLENIRREFVANVSHEIKTPLTAIKGYTETLLHTEIHDPQIRTRFIQKIERNADRLKALVVDILRLAKIESEGEEFTLDGIDCGALIKKTLSHYEDDLAAKSLNLVLDLKPDVHALGDPHAMALVMDNLVTNAIRYTREGGRIVIKTEVIEDKAVISVADNGIGIPEDDLDRIFERFYRVDKARSRDLGGTGLGLSIVKHMVSGMKGEIKVQSKLNQGSTFQVFMSVG